MAPSKKIEKKAEKKMKTPSFGVYIHRVMKMTNPELTLSSKSMDVMNSFVNDVMDRVVGEASKLVAQSRRTTLGANDIQAAVKLVLSPTLAKHAVSEGKKATTLYEKNK